MQLASNTDQPIKLERDCRYRVWFSTAATTTSQDPKQDPKHTHELAVHPTLENTDTDDYYQWAKG
jgi:hypothetical protein